ncbi:ADP-ribosylation factor GTPase-activating protein AGD3-like [Impatiens glandulifera]|uniref:ADP-ribosylation factor GTPase-activating protein AGD3-like n=1 Tax=Impatiens glandulifera TaxID=253017 RepID=UPI001FB17390|nr:ADP-ribosylation factor GTPase-activating protein AGD3-like [Impatiens glandulifera]
MDDKHENSERGGSPQIHLLSHPPFPIHCKSTFQITEPLSVCVFLRLNNNNDNDSTWNPDSWKNNMHFESFDDSATMRQQEVKLHFAKLDDSPMFRQQIIGLEEGAEALRERSLKFCKACRKYTEGLGEGYDKDIAFASAMENFAGLNDPVCVSFGGPVMTKFAIALRELATYKEVLRSKVEQIVNDRLLQFINVDLQDIKEARKRFDKSNATYDQAREKYLSLRKSTRLDIATAIQEELHNARSMFEQTRFNLIATLANTEYKKRFEFLDAVGGAMDAQLNYFKQGYELLHQMEPYINQVLTYAQQSKESSNLELAALFERMHEYKKQVDRETGQPLQENGDAVQLFHNRSCHKEIVAVMQSTVEGKVQTIKQGYLSKRSSNLRGDWKRRYFVLDSRGMLYYYRKQLVSRAAGGGSQNPLHKNNSNEPGANLLSRWLSSHYHGGVHDEKSVARHTVNLMTSTIKADADQSDLRFCFRIISPLKNYTLQAENAVDQMDWIEKITGVITSLLTSLTHDRGLPISPTSTDGSKLSNDSDSSDSFSFSEQNHKKTDLPSKNLIRASRSLQQYHYNTKIDKPVELLKRVPGNDKCADCSATEPDWASLNLGVLICIECSGVHRNLGVHISKVRSLTLDVKVWEPSVINLFQALGNVFVNSIWEGLLQARRTVQADEVRMKFVEYDKQKQFFNKPRPDDHISVKEKFIHAKYAEKRFVHKGIEHLLSIAQQLWESVRTNDKKAVYRLIVTCGVDVNDVNGQHTSSTNSSFSSIMRPIYQSSPDQYLDCSGDSFEASSVSSSPLRESEDNGFNEYLDGCSMLHLACQTSDIGMVELLLQHGANINVTDSKAQTPLHHSITRGRFLIAKLLLSRGANARAIDKDGKSSIDLINESSYEDVEVLALLKNPNR